MVMIGYALRRSVNALAIGLFAVLLSACDLVPVDGSDSLSPAKAQNQAEPSPRQIGEPKTDATSPGEDSDTLSDFDIVTSDADWIRVDDFSSHVWTSGDFRGSFTRRIAGDHERYHVALDVAAGGFDTDVVREERTPTRIDDLDPNLTVAATIDVQLDGSGTWWAGPKFNITRQSTWQGWQDGSFETYVVENASVTPEEFRDTVLHKARFLGQTQNDGATYLHFHQTHNSWDQFWAVRQQFRSTGSVSVVPIMRLWRQHGLTNAYVPILKSANIETDGPVKGDIEITGASYSP